MGVGLLNAVINGLNIVKRALTLVPFCFFQILSAASISNTATMDYISPESLAYSIDSNTVTTTVVPNPSPATIEIYRYSPASSETHLANNTQCFDGNSFVASPAPINRGTPLNNAAPLPITKASAFKSGEVMFVGVTDLNRNTDPLVREIVEVKVITSNGDKETLKLQESAPDSSFFIGAVNTRREPPALAANDCYLTINSGVDLEFDYQDAFFPTDTATASVLVDPFGVVFNSITGALQDGITVTIINDATGLPADVFDDDGVTPYPNVVVTGSTVVSGPNTYQMPSGGYRFPLLASGNYRLVLTNVTDGFQWPTIVDLADLQKLRQSNGLPFAVNPGYDGNAFNLPVGPPLNIDIPIDPNFADLILKKTTSKSQVSPGDFLKYEISIENIGIIVSKDVLLEDKLPLGFKYKKSSLRIGGTKVTDPEMSADGRELKIPLGDMAVGGTRQISYITEVSVQAREGRAVNKAQASRSNGQSSNEDQVSVQVRNAFYASHAVVVGQIYETSSCDFNVKSTTFNHQGVEKVKVYMEDGTYVISDKDGRFHFQKVDPGTHVVQVDESTLPENSELIKCDQNTRTAGRANSRFIDVQGGAIWRTDFYVRTKQDSIISLDYRYHGEVYDKNNNVPSPELIYMLDLSAKEEINDLKATFALPFGLEMVPSSAEWNGSHIEESLEGSHYNFSLNKLSSYESGVLSLKAIRRDREYFQPSACLRDDYLSDVHLEYNTQSYEGRVALDTQTSTCNNPEATKGQTEKVPNISKFEDIFVLDDLQASGGGRNWLEDQGPGLSVLFPQVGHNPRAPSTRVVVKYGLNEKVQLKINGEEVSNRFIINIQNDQSKQIEIKEWKGVPLIEGLNVIEAFTLDKSGNILDEVSRTINFANLPSRIVFVPEKSKIVANGIDKPRIAIRVLDKDGKPVRRGVKGTFRVNAPYVAAQFEEFSQKKQLSSLEKYEPEYFVYTDDGLAFIELSATEIAGEAQLSFFLKDQPDTLVNVWLTPEVKDWIVVGFADGTVGHKTLTGNMESLPDGRTGDQDLDVDGQIKFYAKGRVKGEWILTAAFDSKKEIEFKQDRFKGIIDPNEFYTLYSDGSIQKNDSTSSHKVYLKIEKSKFFALFGDYDTGLSDTELSRYNRSFTGFKSEYSSKHMGFRVFAAEQDSRYFREELQGRGESFQYRLARGDVLVNSEKIKLEERDRFRSDKIVKSQTFTRHIDYNINYRNGTIEFKQRIDSFKNFNPQFLVIEYETLTPITDDHAYGGRVEGRLLEDKVKVGFTNLTEQEDQQKSQLNGLDVRIKFSEDSLLTLEAAESSSKVNSSDLDGYAYRSEFNYRGKKLETNIYLKKTEDSFGLGQQALSELGSVKAGTNTTVHYSDKLDQLISYAHQEQHESGNTQGVASTELRYRHKKGTYGLGLQRIDEKRDNQGLESNQVTANVTRNFINEKLELQLGIEQNITRDQSVDYPDRYLIQGKYKITDKTKVILAEEYSKGASRDTFTTRLGIESDPWSGGKITSSVNQSIAESGPRTFSNMGLSQSYQINKRWSIDGAIDISKTLREEEKEIVPINTSQPSTSGGFLGNNQFSEDYSIVSGGLTYKAAPWSWNIRAENRNGELEDRFGVATNFIRQLDQGITLSTSHSYFVSEFKEGAGGELYTGDFSLAYRPHDSRYTILDRIKYRYETVDNAQSIPIFGQETLRGAEDLTSSALINNFNLNRLSEKRRNQLSLFYGAKLVWDDFDGDKYSSFIDLWGVENRFDISEAWDIGVQAFIWNSWSADDQRYSFGPSIGWSPLTNSWVSVGYNFEGFEDRDFDAAKYTQQGIYLKLRVKFDEKSLGLKGSFE